MDQSILLFIYFVTKYNLSWSCYKALYNFSKKKKTKKLACYKIWFYVLIWVEMRAFVFHAGKVADPRFIPRIYEVIRNSKMNNPVVLLGFFIFYPVKDVLCSVYIIIIKAMKENYAVYVQGFYVSQESK